MTPVPHAARGDCEALAAGPFGMWQPVNTVSSLAFVAAGLWVLGQSADRPSAQRRFVVALAVALVAVGFGSAAFHGSGTPAARRFHDLGIVALLLVVLVRDLADARGNGRVRALAPGGLVVTVVLFGLAARTAAARAAVFLGLVVAAETVAALGGWAPRRTPIPAYRLAIVALAGGGVVHLLSRSGALLCRPESLLQGHAVWHVAAATAVAGWSSAVLGQASPGSTRRAEARRWNGRRHARG